MRNPIIAVTATEAVLLDPSGNDQTVAVELTPTKQLLSQRTVRALLATGFLIHYDTDWAVDEELIAATLADIRRRVLAYIEGEAA